MKHTALMGVMVGLLSFTSACSNAQKQAEGYKGYETPSYSVTDRDNGFEIRDYKPALMAEVRVDGDRSEAANKGFRILAAYIFGENEPAAKVAMTSPVTQTKTTIAMTSPVTQAKVGEEWLVQFMMPSKYTMETLPKAKDDRIRFFMSKPSRRAVVVFSGFTNDGAVDAQTEKLKNWLSSRNLMVKGEPTIAYYDDPFTFPWNRRNEIQFELEASRKR